MRNIHENYSLQLGAVVYSKLTEPKRPFGLYPLSSAYKTAFLAVVLICSVTGLNAQNSTPLGQGIDGEAAGDGSGWSISMPDAQTLAIGAPNNSGNGTNSGHVRVYSWDSNSSSWVQKGSDIDGEAAFDGSGWSISMPDAQTLAIGALRNDGNGNNSGHVRVYSWDSNSSSWVQKGSDIDGEAAGDVSGSSVSMPDAQTLAIGARFNAGNGTNSGHVRVYSWDSNSSSWVQKGSDIDGEAGNDWSGYSVSMPDAQTLAIGAPNNDGNGYNAGQVEVYAFSNYNPNPNNAIINTNGCIECDNYVVRDSFQLNGTWYTVVDRAMLDSMVTNGGDFTKVCVSKVTNMSDLFKYESTFNQDISSWDVSNVTDLSGMFQNAGEFNQDISSWDVSSASDMNSMFFSASNFNQDISSWDVSNATELSGMFQNALSFNQDIGSWNVSNVTDMSSMFSSAKVFNQDIGSWDASSVTDMSNMFNNAKKFNQDIGSWDVSNVTNMNDMFAYTDSFNQNIGSWDVSNVTEMKNMFFNATAFNRDIGSWDVSNITNTDYMFSSASAFNQDIGSWDVSNVTTMSGMFAGASAFNQDLSNWCVYQLSSEPALFNLNGILSPSNMPPWGTCNANDAIVNTSGCVECDNYSPGEFFVLNDMLYTVVNRTMLDSMIQIGADLSTVCVSKITSLAQLFYGNASFNQDISNWDVSNVTNMRSMFFGAYAFNQYINGWDVSKVTDMSWMFASAITFNQNISGWDVSNVTHMTAMFNNARSFNQPLAAWDVSNVTDMRYMFSLANAFNQDLSSWCVGNNITTQPIGFSKATIFGSGALLNPSQLPVWGAPCITFSPAGQ